MLKRLLVLMAGLACLVLAIWMFGRPKRDVRVIFTKGKESPSTRRPWTAKSTARLQQKPLSLSALRKALHKAGHPKTKGFQKLGALPTGELLVGLADGKPPNEHKLPGKLIMFRNKAGQWQPFLGGESIHQIKKAKTGWVAALTSHNKLVLRSPSGNIAFSKERVGINPGFSPSGKHLVYVHKQSIAHHTLVWREVKSGKERALVSRGPLSDPVVSPQEDAVIYTSGKSGLLSLWRTTRDGKQTQLTNVGLRAGGGRPNGFIPPPAGRYPVLWAKHWLVYDAGDGLWAIRDDGSQAYQIVAGNHRPQWDIPGVSVVYTLQGKRMIATLPTSP